MSEFVDLWLTPGLWLLGTCSLRWGVLIVSLWVWFAARRPASSAVRLLAARCVLIAGLLFPFVPTLWGPVLAQEPVDPGPGSKITTTRPPKQRPTRPAARKPVIATEGVPPLNESRILPDVADPPESPVGLASSHSSSSRDPIRWSQWAVLAVTSIWLAGFSLRTLKLAMGWFWLGCLRRNAVAVDDRFQAELDRCRDRLEILRAARLGTHPLVEAPILVGGFRPWILVPAEWQQFAATSREAILLHELSHVRRYDDFARFFEEMVQAAFFFHPLVHWLLSGIAADREELCDADVVNQGVEPRTLAEVLLECCRICGVGRSPLSLRTVVLPFFRRHTVKDRIRFLMEEPAMSWRKSRPSRRAASGIAVVVFGLFAITAGFGLRADDPPPMPGAAAVAPKAAEEAPPNAIKIDLSALISPEDVANLQADRPVEVKGFGKFTLEQLAMSSLSDRDEFPPGEPIARGRLLDIAGNPLVPSKDVPATARVTFLPGEKEFQPFNGLPDRVVWLADVQGRFLASAIPGEMNAIQVQLSGGTTFDVRWKPVLGKLIDIRLPTHLHPKVAPPFEVAADELAGVVVDERGEPLADATVELMDGMACCAPRSFKAVTNKLGRFRLEKLEELFSADESRTVWGRVRKSGYCPVRFLEQPVGVQGLVFALQSGTFIEGTVSGPDGKPVPRAAIRADEGPRSIQGAPIDHLWTDTTADDAGRYRLYVEPGEYELLVRAPGVGAARTAKVPVLDRERRQLDISLEPGATFRATIVDSTTKRPVPNIRLWHWQYPDVDERSDADGKITISDMIPGDFAFDIEAKGYARWWSQEAKSEWSRKSIDDPERNWQRNFDSIDFDLQPGMKPVTIVVEQAARIRGRVVDPDGRPVAGATVAPALTGTGNSLTGDTRFSVETGADGTFDMPLPASNQAKYNLIAHDGKYEEWRKWANAVGPPFSTKPGDDLDGVELKLTRPGSIRGRVVDDQGAPVANFSVQAGGVYVDENRYYVPPAAKTNAKGEFEIRHLRPGVYELSGKQSDEEVRLNNDGQQVTLREGQTIDGGELQVVKLPPRRNRAAAPPPLSAVPEDAPP